jgi:hypothetical protein
MEHGKHWPQLERDTNLIDESEQLFRNAMFCVEESDLHATGYGSFLSR